MLEIKYKNKARLGKPFLLQSRKKASNDVETDNQVNVTKHDDVQQKCEKCDVK
jgi:hypothetical protein